MTDEQFDYLVRSNAFGWLLKFKDKNHYLTQEGYGLGTTCWYVRVEYDGLIKYVCADTKEQAYDDAVAYIKTQEFVEPLFCYMKTEHTLGQEANNLQSSRDLVERLRAAGYEV